MKKIFNHTKRPVPEWEDLAESNYDWDEVDLINESEDYQEEAEEGEASYYAEETGEGSEEYWNDQETYADSEDVLDGGMYYAESGATEDYSDDGDAGDNEAEYYEEGNYEEEAYEEGNFQEGYYEEGDYEAEYYEEGNYEEEYYEEEYYEEEAYDGEEDMEAVVLPAEDTGMEEFDGRSAVTSGTRGKNRRQGFTGMGLMDQMILGTGVAVLILAFVTVGFYISSRMTDRQISSFVTVGNQLNGIDVIGEAGLLAVADAQLAKMAASNILNGSQQEYPNDEGYNESEYRRDVTVTMEFVSIQKDLKIKFVNDNTGKLVANVPFAVQVTDPDGKSFIWSDDDMDGIIYKKDITPGSYKVVMEALTDEKYSNYTLSARSRTVDVKKNITYEKVEVANEIKSEDEIDASKEDTAKNDTVQESALQDTVAWVESKIIDGTYIEVNKSSIPKPTSIVAGSATARTSGTGGVVLTDEEGESGSVPGDGSGITSDNNSGGGSDTTSGNNPGGGSDTTSGNNPGDNSGTTSGNNPGGGSDSDTKTEIDFMLMPSTVITVVGGTVTAQIEGVKVPEGKKPTFSVAAEENKFVTAKVDTDGKITIIGKAQGTTQIPITVSCEGCESVSKMLAVTVNPAKTITLEKTGITFPDESLVLDVSVEDAITPVFRLKSSDVTIATVPETVQGNKITVKGLKEGTVTITVELVESNAVTGIATCTVTVKEHPKNDKVTNLKDENDNKLYILENGEYREAVYADFYVESNKFYLMTDPKYNGWQNINGKVYYFTADGKYVTGEQVIQGAKYNFASDGTLVTGSGILGIDVSKWNSNINWNAVKKSGVNFVIIRCGYRGSSVGSLIEDPQFKANIQGAISAGIKVGIYFFTQALDEREAVEEASMVLELIKNYKISYPIFLDVESSGGRADAIDKATRTAVCKAFCQTIQNKGYTAGIYANKSWLETKLDPSALSAYKIWLAQYRSSPTYAGRYDLWQYSSTGRINGITGDVDMNLSYLGY